MTDKVNEDARVRIIAGCMSGTSIDGVDAALVKIIGRDLDISAEVISTASVDFGDLEPPLSRFAMQVPFTAGEIADLSRKFSQIHVEVIAKLKKRETIDLIAVHGQTVYHKPPLTWQMIDASYIAHEMKTPVVYNLRSADINLGGQGAPITPLADHVLYDNRELHQAVVNLGGFCNITLLPEYTEFSRNIIRGFDVCVCNQLLNGIAQKLIGKLIDVNGELAAEGVTVETPLNDLLQTLRKQKEQNRSLGSGDEGSGWIDRYKLNYRPQDIARTACAGLAAVIAENVAEADQVILAGGGAANLTLLEELRKSISANVSLSDDFGIPSTHREAVAMAVLGALCQDRIPITLSQVTGVAQPPVAGNWVHP